jgi:hypothetical protein
MNFYSNFRKGDRRELPPREPPLISTPLITWVIPFVALCHSEVGPSFARPTRRYGRRSDGGAYACRLTV